MWSEILEQGRKCIDAFHVSANSDSSESRSRVNLSCSQSENVTQSTL